MSALVESPIGIKVVGFVVLRVVKEARMLTVLNDAAAAAASIAGLKRLEQNRAQN